MNHYYGITPSFLKASHHQKPLIARSKAVCFGMQAAQPNAEVEMQPREAQSSRVASEGQAGRRFLDVSMGVSLNHPGGQQTVFILNPGQDTPTHQFTEEHPSWFTGEPEAPPPEPLPDIPSRFSIIGLGLVGLSFLGLGSYSIHLTRHIWGLQNGTPFKTAGLATGGIDSAVTFVLGLGCLALSAMKTRQRVAAQREQRMNNQGAVVV